MALSPGLKVLGGAMTSVAEGVHAVTEALNTSLTIQATQGPSDLLLQVFGSLPSTAPPWRRPEYPINLLHREPIRSFCEYLQNSAAQCPPQAADWRGAWG